MLSLTDGPSSSTVIIKEHSYGCSTTLTLAFSDNFVAANSSGEWPLPDGGAPFCDTDDLSSPELQHIEEFSRVKVNLI